MHPALQIAAVVLLGVAVFAIAHLSRRRHYAKFGPPPPGSNSRTLLWFFGCSVGLGLLAWLSMTAFWVLLVAMFVASQTVGGFRAQPWGPWQQFRDGALGAAVITAPLLTIAVVVTRG